MNDPANPRPQPEQQQQHFMSLSKTAEMTTPTTTTTTPPLDLQAVHDEMVSVAYEAGRMILAANPADLDTGTKLNSVDIVTEADRAVEKMVWTRLSEAFPSVSFMGEETYKPGVRLGPEPTFVVDPIVGTTSFVHGFPNACISLGLAIERSPAVGVIYNPWQDL
ncbi:hypothetical protein E4U41_002956, partial [Claviceps citrina]